jgi:hypothetical protein
VTTRRTRIHMPVYRAMLDREAYNGPQDVALIGGERLVSERIDERPDAGNDKFSFPFDAASQGRAHGGSCAIGTPPAVDVGEFRASVTR